MFSICLSCLLETTVGSAGKATWLESTLPKGIPALSFTRKSIGQSQETPSRPVDRLQKFPCRFDNSIRNDGAKMENRPLKVLRQMKKPLLDQVEGSVVSSGPFDTQCAFAARWEQECHSDQVL